MKDRLSPSPTSETPAMRRTAMFRPIRPTKDDQPPQSNISNNTSSDGMETPCASQMTLALRHLTGLGICSFQRLQRILTQPTVGSFLAGVLRRLSLGAKLPRFIQASGGCQFLRRTAVDIWGRGLNGPQIYPQRYELGGQDRAEGYILLDVLTTRVTPGSRPPLQQSCTLWPPQP
ncbi:hypothetical protein ASPBRDRAFT_24721 [Aspergillus brasiliensis CBS 101740]|uniref:Uncharacterized protein n=1 Tax=Aspergillus brasiliensis (strain CBS 101740 / IMI 381727 / IBT 21946) TaxID=767769 RepID=A0A1L9UZE5_ASPBC|nr:hypothetical protein ASPBRDRAFT_24721 [Aspergillus brasiliensis CBS 101740]